MEVVSDNGEGNISDASVATTSSQMSGATTRRDRRGRPPSTGEYVDLAAAQKLLRKEEEKRLKLQAEKELLDSVTERRRTRSLENITGYGTRYTNLFDSECETTTRKVKERVTQELLNITEIARKSGNMKGTLVKSIKESAQEIHRMTEILLSRSVSEETQRLQAENDGLKKGLEKLRKEMEDVREEIWAMRAAGRRAPSPSPCPLPVSTPMSQDTEVEREMEKEMPPPSTPPPKVAGDAKARTRQSGDARIDGFDMENLMRNVLIQVGTMINARLEAQESRLPPEISLRPSLGRKVASSNRLDPLNLPTKQGKEEGKSATPLAKGTEKETERGTKKAPVLPTTKTIPIKTKKGKGARKGKKDPSPSAPRETRSFPPPPDSMSVEWSVMTSGGRERRGYGRATWRQRQRLSLRRTLPLRSQRAGRKRRHLTPLQQSPRRRPLRAAMGALLSLGRRRSERKRKRRRVLRDRRRWS